MAKEEYKYRKILKKRSNVTPNKRREPLQSPASETENDHVDCKSLSTLSSDLDLK